MKAQSIGRKLNRGIATLEILIAFTIFILCISGVVIVNFSNQSIAIDLQTNNEAISKAQKGLEDARALSRENFESVETSSIVNDDIYQKQTIVPIGSITDCGKNVESVVNWSVGSRTLNVNFVTHIVDIAHALANGGDCDDTAPGDWDNPVSDVSVGIGGQGATDIDVRNDFIYLTSDPSAVPKEDFFIYEFDSTALTLIERGKIHVSPGLNAVDVIEGYAFTINTTTSNQLIVFNVSIPSTPTPFAPISLPNTTVGIARSIFYYNNFIYIGTQYQACPSCPPLQNNEFHIYNVNTPGAPVWKGSFKVNHNINAIVVRDDYAYLATSDNNGEVYVYNVSDPTDISFEGLFDAPGSEDGEAIYLLGNKIYLGRDRTPAARKDFYILNIDPLDPGNITESGSKNLGLNPGTIVTDIIVKGQLAFVGLDNPTSGLQILNISNPASITNHPMCTSLNFSENSTAMDAEGDFIFSANSANDEIRIIRDQVSICS